MKTLIILLVCLLSFCKNLQAQTFTNNIGGAIPNNNTELCFPVTVSGIGTINSTSFGLEKICLNITHPSDGDLEISLKSPGGAIISLCKRRGLQGDNYINTCFSTNATKSISGGVAPFTDTYCAETAVGLVNNGQNADGVWNLCIKDVFQIAGSAGSLQNFSLTFSTNPSGPLNPITIQDCMGAIPICSPIYNEQFSYVGTGNYPGEIGLGTTCLGSERNSVWYTFTTQTAGVISFVITPKVLSEDYDWAVFNLTNNKCSDLLTNPNLDVRCNFSGTAGPTGPNGGTGGPFTPTIAVQARETYVILVSHFSNTTNGYTIDFSASTAIVFDTSHPTIKQAKPLNPCSTDQIDIELSENVLCNSIKPADFTISGPGAPYSILAVKSANCIGSAAYTKTFSVKLNKAIDSAGAYQVCFSPAPGSLVDLCGNNGLAGCVNFSISSKDTPLFNIKDTICKGTLAPNLPATSLNGINGVWTPSVISNTISGTYTFTASLPQCAIPTSLGMIVLPNPNVGNDTSVSICQGDSINLTTFYDTTNLSFQWTLNGIPVGNALSVGTAGSYQIQVSDSNHCIDKAIVNLAVKPISISLDNIDICNNQLPFLWNGNSYNAAGIYKDTLVNAAGCDSILTLNLTIKPNSFSTTNIALCSNQLPFIWNGNTYNAAGIYKDTLVNAAGCDSIITLNLTLTSNSFSTTNIAVCSKQLPFIWNGNTYNAAGVYKDTLVNSAGCDSIITLNLTLKPNAFSTTNIAVCSKQLPFIWNGNTYNAAGIYKDTLVNAAGCDSIITLNLTLTSNSFSTTNIAVCSKQLPFIWNGNTYNAAGIYKDTLVNAAGCDSIITLNLSIKPNSFSTTNIAVCSKQLPFIWNGNSYNASGVYKDTLVNAAGCDSIITLNLTLKPNSFSTTTIAVCSKQLPFIWNGKSYNAAGVYKDTLVNAAGCDSIITLNLSIKPNSFSTTNIAICNKQLPFIWNGNTYNAAGIYKDTLVNAAGCDSIITLNLSIKPNSFSTTNIAVCSNQLPYTWNGNTYNAAGIYKDTLVNAAGCDSIITLNLTLKPNAFSTTNIAVCSKQLPFLWNGNSYNAAGVYKDTLVNAAGCDSILTLNLTLKPNSFGTTTIAVCSKQLPFIWNGNTYNAAGVYKDTLVNAAGCDSILTLNLTLKPNAFSITTYAVCSNQLPFIWNGNTYNAAGVYKDTLVNAAGCDSIITLNLSVKPNSFSTTNMAVCVKQLPFLWNGNMYNAAGVYKDTLVNAAGCDSILTLNLTLTSNSFSTTNIAVCSKQLPLLWNGNAYNAAGVYKDTLVNATGCDSIITLNLTIMPNSFSITNIAVCSKQLPYTWNGNAYNTAGVYTRNLINSIGCDSIATLNLSVKQISFSNTTIAICSSQLPYIWNGKTYLATGLYKDTLINAAGCDSILTLHLTVRSTDSSQTVVAVCPEQLPYVWNGNNYTAAGIYTIKLTSTSGCDSIAILKFSIKPSPQKPLVTSNSPLCSGDTLEMVINESISGTTYKWFGPKGFSSQLQNIILNKIDTSNAGIYSAIAYLNGCVSIPANTIVEIKQTPIVDAGPDKLAYEGDTIQLLPKVLSSGNLKYTWVPNLYFITPDTIRNPKLIGIKSITYYLTAALDNQCFSTADPITIKILPRKTPFVFPTAFSPNGDGVNDTWVLSQLSPYSHARVQIFNRMGMEVFSSVGYRSPWDGTFKGRPLPTGTYYYVIEPGEKNNTITGWVMLLR